MTHKFTLGAITVAMAVLPLSAFTSLSSRSHPIAVAVPPSHVATAVAPNASEPHPEIRRAIASLRKARSYMEHAAHDFGGHRVAAMKACDDAIAQLQMALQYDKH